MKVTVPKSGRPTYSVDLTREEIQHLSVAVGLQTPHPDDEPRKRSCLRKLAKAMQAADMDHYGHDPCEGKLP